jgi:hypothetical protein
MATSPERLKIMKMVQDGKITPEEGIELLDMLSEKNARGKVTTPDQTPSPKSTAQWFRMVVTDTKTGKTRVNVRLPVSLIGAGMKMGAKFSVQGQGVDQAHLAELIRNGSVGKVIDVYDDDDSEHVEVYIE